MVFLAHDLEELASIEVWTRTHADRVPEIAQPLLPVATTEFAVSVVALLIILLAVASRAARTGTDSRWFDVFLLLVGVLGVNGIGHILQAAVFGGYVPGLITAITMILPYGLWVFARLNRLGLRSRSWQGGLLAVAMVVHVPIAALALVLGRALA